MSKHSHWPDRLSILLLIFSFSLTTGFSQGNWQQKVESDVFEAIRNDKKADCLLILREQAALSPPPASWSKDEKGQYVFDRLQEVAQESQVPVIEELQRQDLPHRSYYLINAIWTRLDQQKLNTIASRSDIYRIVHDPWVKMIPPRTTPATQHRNAVEWGLRQIQADQVWAEGFTGQGVVIGGQDTGYDWDHPALIDKYRGWNGSEADHNYNWRDAIHELNPLHQDSTTGPFTNPCGLDVNRPCDDGDHGTHTMGTMVGDDGMGNQIGVAPGAQWIGCRNMDRGYGKPSTYLECFEWFLAPTDLNGMNPDPSKAPHVINNSWSCPTIEGCNQSNFDILRTAIRNLTMAGVVVVVSAGNNGFGGCESVNAPPSIFEEAFAIGATNSVDTLAAFSSLGPVGVDSSFRQKPDVSAPGVWIRSCVPDSSYGNKSGTSMSGPHAAGAVALLISAKPQLAGKVDSLEKLLQATAVPAYPAMFTLDNFDCGPYESFPNFYTGSGRIDVFAAFEKATTISTVPSLDQELLFVVRPNPFQRSIQITAPDGKEGQYVIQIYTVEGQRIFTDTQWLSSNNAVQLNLPGLSSGTYLLRIIGNKGAFEKKIICQGH